MRLVIKFAGALLDDTETMQPLARQVAALAREGHELLVVHGGGKLFTATLGRMGIESRFVDGLRVTDASIFPTMPSGNTNAPCIMVGEKCADLIRSAA